MKNSIKRIMFIVVVCALMICLTSIVVFASDSVTIVSHEPTYLEIQGTADVGQYVPVTYNNKSEIEKVFYVDANKNPIFLDLDEAEFKVPEGYSTLDLYVIFKSGGSKSFNATPPSCEDILPGETPNPTGISNGKNAIAFEYSDSPAGTFGPWDKNNSYGVYYVKAYYPEAEAEGKVAGYATTSFHVIDNSTYSIVINEPENGTVTTDKTTDLKLNDKVKFKVTPDEGYKLDKLTVLLEAGGSLYTSLGEDGYYTIDMPRSNLTVTATFKEIPKDITTDLAEGVSVDTKVLEDVLVGMRRTVSTSVLYLNVSADKDDINSDELDAIKENVDSDGLIAYNVGLFQRYETYQGGMKDFSYGDRNETLISITYPFDFEGKENVTVLRAHTSYDADAKGMVTKCDTLSESGDEYVTFDKKAGTITVTAYKYSTYAIAYDNVVPEETTTAAPGETTAAPGETTTAAKGETTTAAPEEEKIVDTADINDVALWTAITVVTAGVSVSVLSSSRKKEWQ